MHCQRVAYRLFPPKRYAILPYCRIYAIRIFFAMVSRINEFAAEIFLSGRGSLRGYRRACCKAKGRLNARPVGRIQISTAELLMLKGDVACCPFTLPGQHQLRSWKSTAARKILLCPDALFSEGEGQDLIRRDWRLETPPFSDPCGGMSEYVLYIKPLWVMSGVRH